MNSWLPKKARAYLAPLKSKLKRWRRRYRLTHLSKSQPTKIVIGSGGTKFEGWIQTERDDLNLVIASDWESYFPEDSLDAILAEHVWEHLTPAESIVAAKNCFRFLKSGGRLRVAVPDGYHPNPRYIEDVMPGGVGLGAEDHKVLFTYVELSKIFQSVGFEVKLLEYFDESGDFHFVDWATSDGFVERSKRFDDRNRNLPLSYTSIILDALKK
jgi:predicted SAM-dependent methyltransferase